jgi:hypothetical protein
LRDESDKVIEDTPIGDIFVSLREIEEGTVGAFFSSLRGFEEVLCTSSRPFAISKKTYPGGSSLRSGNSKRCFAPLLVPSRYRISSEIRQDIVASHNRCGRGSPERLPFIECHQTGSMRRVGESSKSPQAP